MSANSLILVRTQAGSTSGSVGNVALLPSSFGTNGADTATAHLSLEQVVEVLVNRSNLSTERDSRMAKVVEKVVEVLKELSEKVALSGQDSGLEAAPEGEVGRQNLERVASIPADFEALASEAGESENGDGQAGGPEDNAEQALDKEPDEVVFLRVVLSRQQEANLTNEDVSSIALSGQDSEQEVAPEGEVGRQNLERVQNVLAQNLALEAGSTSVSVGNVALLASSVGTNGADTATKLLSLEHKVADLVTSNKDLVTSNKDLVTSNKFLMERDEFLTGKIESLIENSIFLMEKVAETHQQQANATNEEVNSIALIGDSGPNFEGA
jgi:hypothetical protein